MAENQVINLKIITQVDQTINSFKKVQAEADRLNKIQQKVSKQAQKAGMNQEDFLRINQQLNRRVAKSAQQRKQFDKMIHDAYHKQQIKEQSLAKSVFAERHKREVAMQNLVKTDLKEQAKAMRDNQRRLSKLGNAALGAGLSMLFLGMQIKAISQRTLQSIFKTFSEVTQGTMAYNQTVGRVSAAFEYLKFSIADAFMTSALGQALVEKLVSIFDFLSSASDETKIFLVIVLLLGVAFGALAMVIGQLIIPLKVALDAGYGLKAIAKGIGVGFLIIAVILAAIYGLVKIWNGNMSLTKKIVYTTLLLFVAMLVILVLMGVSLATMAAPLALLIALAIALGLALILAGDEFKLGFLKAALSINNAIINYIIDPINDAIEAFNNLMGTKFGPVGGDTISKAAELDSKIKSLEASITQKKAEREAQKSEDNSTSNVTKNINIESFTAKAESVGGAINEAMDLDQYNSLSGE